MNGKINSSLYISNKMISKRNKNKYNKNEKYEPSVF